MAEEFQFWRIGEARAEIKRLETLNASLQAKITALESNPGEIVAEAEKAVAERDSKIISLKAETDRLAAESAKQAKIISDNATRIAGLDSEIETKASARAAAIASSQAFLRSKASLPRTRRMTNPSLIRA